MFRPYGEYMNTRTLTIKSVTTVSNEAGTILPISQGAVARFGGYEVHTIDGKIYRVAQGIRGTVDVYAVQIDGDQMTITWSSGL